MKQAAIDKARSRFEKATECVTRIERSGYFAEFESAWTDFLLAANVIWSALEQGVKDTPQSRQWFGGKKMSAERTHC
jgi:hypothetical protein